MLMLNFAPPALAYWNDVLNEHRNQGQDGVCAWCQDRNCPVKLSAEAAIVRLGKVFLDNASPLVARAPTPTGPVAGVPSTTTDRPFIHRQARVPGPGLPRRLTLLPVRGIPDGPQPPG